MDCTDDPKRARCAVHNTIFDHELAWCADCVHEEVLRIHREVRQAAIDRSARIDTKLTPYRRKSDMPSPKRMIIHNCPGWPDTYEWQTVLPQGQLPKSCPRCKQYLRHEELNSADQRDPG